MPQTKRKMTDSFCLNGNIQTKGKYKHSAEFIHVKYFCMYFVINFMCFFILHDFISHT